MTRAFTYILWVEVFEPEHSCLAARPGDIWVSVEADEWQRYWVDDMTVYG